LNRALAWMALVALTEGAGILLVVPVLAVAGVPPASRLERFLVALLGPGAPSARAILPLLLVGVGLIALRALWMRGESAATVALQIEVAGGRRERLHRALLAMAWPAVVRERRDAWQHLLMVRTDEVQNSVLLLTRLAFDAVVVGVMIVVSLVAAPGMTGLVVGGIAVALLVRAGAGRGAQSAGQGLVTAGDALAEESGAQLAGLRMIRGAGAEQVAGSRFTAVTERYHGAIRRSAALAVRDRGAWAVATSVVLAVVLWAAVGPARVSPATLLLLVAVWGRLVPRVVGLRTAARDIAESLPAWSAVDDAIERAEMAAESTASDAGGRWVPSLEQELRVDGITFRWATGSAPVLRDLTVSIRAHALTVVTGPTGAGKSTLGDLLLGLVAPEGGRILVDGHAMDAAMRLRWRRAVGYLAQEPVLLAGTVRENLRWTRPDATDVEMHEALRLAAADFVATLPHGLDSPIGDRGTLLSGGERQRLALARALLGAPVLLILDEATSALDAATEGRILETLRALRARTTIVLISHRAAARAAADAEIAL
jgi:ATP-binding cassette subfamily C protein